MKKLDRNKLFKLNELVLEIEEKQKELKNIKKEVMDYYWFNIHQLSHFRYNVLGKENFNIEDLRYIKSIQIK